MTTGIFLFSGEALVGVSGVGLAATLADESSRSATPWLVLLVAAALCVAAAVCTSHVGLHADVDALGPRRHGDAASELHLPRWFGCLTATFAVIGVAAFMVVVTGLPGAQ